MYLHFEDWSAAPTVPERLAGLGLPHRERVIKVFVSGEDPRIALGRSAMTVVEGDGSAFSAEEEYSYEGRESYPGPRLEEDLAAYDLSDLCGRRLRSLFRFSNEQGFCQAAMAARKNGVWVIDHPFQSIDGIDAAKQRPDREKSIHLDIFFPGSLESLSSIVDYDDENAIVGWEEGVRWLNEPS